jgi:hypothetical protein
MDRLKPVAMVPGVLADPRTEAAAFGLEVLGAGIPFCRMRGVSPVVELNCEPTAATVPSLRAVTPESEFA